MVTSCKMEYPCIRALYHIQTSHSDSCVLSDM
ncbi:hypothetical protein CDL12_22610 [Handroanthus impetiginosus]|uniref:Uncharacterized protein n=1 Tax=Handroanthus impetiginosus TaxID=429701 RepID=A0A2G9GHV1_9LAMI|nr:hypothetical protein CDL12_22610 [Handroanthus impetiginosus]